jgi:hypothetical protein
MAQYGGFMHNINVLGYFWPKFGFLTPWVPIYRVPLNWYAVDYEDIALRFTLNVFFGYFVLSNGPNWEDFLHNSNIWGRFWSKFWFLNPRGAHL